MTATRMTQQSTVLIVDDDEAVRDSLEALLMAAGHPTRLYDHAAPFLAAVGEPNPVNAPIGCVLLDVRLPDGDGIEILSKLVSAGFMSPVIIITGHGDVPMAVRAMRIGAADFVEKPFDPDVLLASVKQAMETLDRQSQTDQDARQARAHLAKLSPRESDVMRKLVAGRANKVIAHELDLSPRTVEIHRSRVMQKTGATSLSHLVRIAIAAGVEFEP